jgi:hypothetical protein
MAYFNFSNSQEELRTSENIKLLLPRLLIFYFRKYCHFTSDFVEIFAFSFKSGSTTEPIDGQMVLKQNQLMGSESAIKKILNKRT